MLRPFWLSLLGLLACSRNLDVPPVPAVNDVPQILDFSPRNAFAGDQLILHAKNFDPRGNQLIFPGGKIVLADHPDDGGLDALTEDGGLSFSVPDGLDYNGPLILAATLGRSAPSRDEFGALGNGHPNIGTPVAQLRFRHDPVGLVDRTENVLMASSIFDLIVTDGKAFRRVPGHPLALKRSPTMDRALLSVATPTGGQLLEVDSANGEVKLTSVESDTRERFILPPFDPGTALARTIGVNALGETWLSTWTAQGTGLISARQKLTGIRDPIGAAALGGLVIVIAYAPLENTPSVFTASPLGVTRTWSPASTSCATLECEAPDGPVAVVPPVTAGDPPSMVISLASGDLLVLDRSPVRQRTLKLISYAPINALAGGVSPGKVVFTKALDGALFQLDLETEDVDWAVQLRGEPTVIDVAADIDEIAVGNRLDNSVDIVTASSGVWTGRIAFNLGLGSADGMGGGIVAPYTYEPPRAEPFIQRMDLLMRNVGLVVSIDASSLEVLDHVVLDPDIGLGAPLRLFVTHELRTLVVREDRLSVLEQGMTERTERIVTPLKIPRPIDVLELPTGELVVSSLDAIRAYRWTGTGQSRVLVSAGELRLPVDATLLGMAIDGEQAMVMWRTSGGTVTGGFFRLADFQSGVPRKVITLPTGLADFLGIVPLREGPIVLFGRGTGGPSAITAAALQSGGDEIPSVISGKTVSGVSPDGRYVVWLDESSAERTARLVQADPEGLTGYSTYRIVGSAAGPAFDPSGQWFYIPVPLVDQLDVVQ